MSEGSFDRVGEKNEALPVRKATVKILFPITITVLRVYSRELIF